MNEQTLITELIIREKLEWIAAEKLLRAYAWLTEGPSYLKRWKGPALLDCLVLRREPEASFDRIVRH